jgi:hypothetical protein
MRMYFFVPYHLSGIQKGIQAGHCALEYATKYGKTLDYKVFMDYHKTWVILNGGTTMDCNDFGKSGDLNLIAQSLYGERIDFAYFREPDLNNALTALCFLASEQVYDRKTYPDLAPCKEDEKYDIETIRAWVKSLGGRKNAFLRQLITGKHLA